jgi:hypothetical protein
MEMSGPSHYTILVPSETLRRADKLLAELRLDRSRAGGYLQEILAAAPVEFVAPLDLLALLFDTRRPQIFAESEVAGDGSDWSLTELSLLGDVSVAVPVTIFDNGAHRHAAVHATPFKGMLVFTAGALLDNGHGHTPADWSEVVGSDSRVNPDGLLSLYRRRLVPVLRHIDAHAASRRSALVTVPGIGCGQFAGPFHGQLAPLLEAVLRQLLHDHGKEWPNIRAIHFDPYSQGSNSREQIHGILFQVRPSRAAGNQPIPQLCPPPTYATAEDNFYRCCLYSIVAWDHVSWPGNDFYIGSRCTDDGVKAAATDAMAVITGVAGRYDPQLTHYLPPAPFHDWNGVVEARIRSHGLRLWNPVSVVVSG